VTDAPERERDYYRRQCAELGARVVRLHEEQTRARREARRSQTLAALIRELYQLSGITSDPDDIGRRCLRVILDKLNVDRAALLTYNPGQNRFVSKLTLGFPHDALLDFIPAHPPDAFHFTNASNEAGFVAESLCRAMGGPFVLWAFEPQKEMALLLVNDTEDRHLHRPFEKEDREIVAGALSVFIEITEQKKAENLAALSRLALKLSEATPGDDITALIADELNGITGAVLTSMSLFLPEEESLEVKHLAYGSLTLDGLNAMFGQSIIEWRLPLTPDQKSLMMNYIVKDLTDLSEATFGRVPAAHAADLHKRLGIGEIKALVLRYGDELMGTITVIMPEGRPLLSVEWLKTFAHMAAVALRRKKAEDALRESETRYRTLAENYPNGAVFLFDHDLRHTVADGAALGDLGISRSVIGKEASESFNPPMWALFEPRYRAALAGKSGVFEMQHGRITYEVRIRPVRDEAGRVEAGVVLLQNITQRKHTEEELRKARTELEARVKERTAELADANRALKAENAVRKRTEKKLVASLMEKEVLLKELYHRTKNNMQVIRSILALHAYSTRNREVKKVFRDTENRICAMALVHQKLYQSQNLSSIDLKEYFEDLTGLLTESLRVSTNRIAILMSVQNCRVTIDTAIPCGLILNELLSNSLKHAFPGTRKGEIRIKLSKSPGGKLELRFSDDGIGVPKTFDFRKQESIGLKIIFAIAEHQLGGRAGFKAAGKGVSFHLRFPEETTAPKAAQ
jgi:PAS domain S-box-containing protein